MVVNVTGLPGSGKSYFATRLASLIDASYISSDIIRKSLFSKSSYSVKEKRTVYLAILDRIKSEIKLNKDIVVDATFYNQDIREQMTTLVEKRQDVLFMEIVADEALIKERVSKRRQYSDADFKVYEKIKKQWEAMEEPHLVLPSTNNNIAEMLNKAVNYLAIHNDKTTIR